MKILILNWRDIKNPKSGGAEILTHEMAKRWVSSGHEVTQFSSEFRGSKNEEIIDGVKVLRKGFPDARFVFSSVHYQALLSYKKNFRGKVDVVIDEVHGIPFFTPWYVKEKRVALICEVAEDIWLRMFGPFYGSLGRLVEIFYLRFLYQNIPIITISRSTRDELVRGGIKKGKIKIIPMGINLPSKLENFKKEKNPTIIYVGRLSKAKGVEDAIFSMRKIIKAFPDACLWVVGHGEEDYLIKLKKLSIKNKLNRTIIFWGFVTEQKKFELMQKAHVLIAPSIREGWGLTIPEAASVGTPSVVYNSPGLRDVLNEEKYKIVVKSNDPNSLADEVILTLSNKKEYKRLNLDYSWDKTAKSALEVLEK